MRSILDVDAKLDSDEIFIEEKILNNHLIKLITSAETALVLGEDITNTFMTIEAIMNVLKACGRPVSEDIWDWTNQISELFA